MRMCINSCCPEPSHPDNATAKFCVSCGTSLLLENTYVVQKLLSDDSGFGRIYEVVALPESPPKILKVLRPDFNNDTKVVELFQQEMYILGQLNHPGIPKVELYFHHELRDRTLLHGIIMEKIDGQNLEEWLKEHRDRPLGEADARQWLRQVVEALEVLHGQKFFHRDIKPANIMRRTDGSLVLIDFGTVREASHTYLAKIGSVQGVTCITSAGYTPQEQSRGFAVPQSDFYALGMTFIHLVTGCYPLDLSDREQNRVVWRAHAPQISDAFADLLDHLTAEKPRDRPLNCGEILQQLQPPPPRLKPLWLGAIALGLLLIGVGGGFWAGTRTSTPPSPSRSR
ncbi:MAG: serine/threonine protein kinase [Oscillatoriales cyanobacterium SM2_2_1]|nr:serine/threonine protein kinase [Oscillatoriales cyanobacterium SM2_2_1]